MVKNIVNLTIAAASMIVLAVQMEAVVIVGVTELIQIDREKVLLDKNPWIGTQRMLRRTLNWC